LLTRSASKREHGSLLVEKVRLVAVGGVNTEQTECKAIFWTEGRAHELQLLAKEDTVQTTVCILANVAVVWAGRCELNEKE
jgi:hypothetical protein